MAKIQHRGPDRTTALQRVSAHPNNIYMGFHRLALVSDDTQPLVADQCVLVCNGMVWNYVELVTTHELTDHMRTKNDCEVIIHLYRKYGISVTLDMLDGFFAFVLYDERTSQVIAANDHLGIRPLFYGTDRQGSYTFASEVCALADVCDAQLFHFEPGHVLTIDYAACRVVGTRMRRWWAPVKSMLTDTKEHMGAKMFSLLQAAVRKQLLSDRPVACLLSGGLDSSIVAALLALELETPLHTFSVGFENSPDLLAARKVAAHIGSVHCELVVSADDMLAHSREIVDVTQSPDITTNRASTAMSLLCKHIAETTEFKAIFNGDCSEEIWASYAYSKRAPSDQAFLEDNWRLIDEVHYYDVLRSDRCIARYGMDARTPFADRALVEYVMRIPPAYKRHYLRGTPEKQMLREHAQRYLPAEIAWRPKTAFSDGVSQEHSSWHTMLLHYYAGQIADDADNEFREWAASSSVPTQEAFFFCSRFAALFGHTPSTLRADARLLVPRYWMPRFVDTSAIRDPSARELPSTNQK